MRFGVLAPGLGWYVRDLQRAAKGRGDNLAVLAFTRIVSAVGGGGGAISFEIRENQSTAVSGVTHRELDAVLVRTMPPGTLEQIVFRMDALRQVERSGVPVLNPPVALETAIDKYLCCSMLADRGIEVPRSVICESSDDALAAFERLGGDVVIKPIFGSEGKGVSRINDPETAYRVFRALESVGSVLFLQEFIAHEEGDLRVFVLDGKVLAAIKRIPTSDWRSNISRGGKPEVARLSDREQALALEAARLIGAPVAGVDLIPAADGRLAVLEVNAVPGWKGLSSVTGIDVATRLLQFLAKFG